MSQEVFPLPLRNAPQDHRYQPPSLKLLTENQWAYLRRRYRMTNRELEIARLVCTGMSNDCIAAEANIALGTVKTHLRNIYRKIWVNTKIEMLLRFVEDANGLTS